MPTTKSQKTKPEKSGLKSEKQKYFCVFSCFAKTRTVCSFSVKLIKGCPLKLKIIKYFFERNINIILSILYNEQKIF